ncbi:MAG: hypothetical protein K2L03_05785, partial [Bacteroidales bacterium]|nr:hypothetical protein [Bacteroidales bacterium]
MEFDPYTREAVVYTKSSGLVKLSDFLYEYYDINVRKGVDLYTPIKISRNGKRIVGFYYEEGAPVPYCQELSDAQILPRARKISARAARGQEEAYVTWQEPMNSEHTLTGYNIYRDDEASPLNTLLLPAAQNTYTDNTVAPGQHTYYVEAVYGDGSAMKQASNPVRVVGPGVAFPVQAIAHRLDYNRYATVYWGVPSSEVAALAKNDIMTPGKNVAGRFDYTGGRPEVTEFRSKSYISTALDYIANIDMLTYAGRAAVKIGDNYYTSSHTGGGITVIDRFNDVVGNLRPDGLGIVVSMVYVEDQHQLYCGTAKDVKVLDLATGQILVTYPIPANHLSYVPDMKDGKPGLLAGGIHNCNAYLWDEEEKDYVLDQENFFDFTSLYVMGAAYYKDRLYVSSATGPYRNEVYIYDFATQRPIAGPVQVTEDPALYNLLTDNGNALLVANLASSTMAGGLSVCELEDGTTALGMVFQLAYFTARFMLLELESAENVEGYDLYRSVNGGAYDKVNKDGPMTTRRYAETIDKAGQYTYYVTVKSANGAADSEKSPVDTLTVTEQGACPPPDFTVRESNRWPVLSWMPNSSDNILVGFDIYRDDAPIARFWNNDMRLEYIDDAVAGLGTYHYRLEALYDDGCVAAKTASITLTGEGVAKEPFGLTGTKKRNSDYTYKVTVAWETPMFEEPLSLKYCNGVQGESIGFDNFYECWGLIGWKEHDLDLYRDLYLVGMEYMVGEVPDLYEAIVYINDEQVYSQQVPQIAPRSWRTVWFAKSFPMNQEQEVAVGFHTKYSAEAPGVLGVDPTVTVNGKSNLISLDGGDNWSTLQAGGIAGSWLLGALVVHKRDLEAAQNADGTIDHTKLEGRIMRVQPSCKAPLQLLGFNVY